MEKESLSTRSFWPENRDIQGVSAPSQYGEKDYILSDRSVV